MVLKDSNRLQEGFFRRICDKNGCVTAKPDFPGILINPMSGFIGSGAMLKNSSMLMRISPLRFVFPQNAIPREHKIRHHRNKRRWDRGDHNGSSVIVPVLCISYQSKRDTPESWFYCSAHCKAQKNR